MSDLIVINLGLPKSGTTTLARALRRAGLPTVDFRVRPDQSSDITIHDAYVGELMYQGYFNSGDPMYYLSEFSALSEISVLRGDKSLWPQTDWAVISALRAEHPGIRFVASWRDPQQMSDSMLRWSNLATKRLPGATVPGLPLGYGETTAQRVRWIEGHYASLQQFFEGAEDFLIYDTASPHAADLLSGFLELQLPWWGKANANPRSQVA